MTTARLAAIAAVCLPLLAQDAGQADPRGIKVLTDRDRLLNGKTYALLIGISKYEHDPPVPSLQFAHKDAESFRDLLRKPIGGTLPDTQIRLLTNEKATRAAIDDAVNEFVIPNAAPNNTFILFVAAHGVFLTTEVDSQTGQPVDRKPYILTYDSNHQDPKTTGYDMDEFRLMLAKQAKSYGRVLVFVDVCHAERVGGIAGVSPYQKEVEDVFQGDFQLGLLMATQAKKSALESRQFGDGHGVFSYYLISGLNGAAAEPGANSLSFVDLYDYVHTKVYRETHHAQEPDKRASAEMVIVPNVHLEGLALPPIQPLTPAEARDIAKNRQPRGIATAAPSAAVLPQNENPHTSHSDRGQQIVYRYLDGEQEALTQPDFEQCARDFAEAYRLAPANTYDHSRELFCRGRAEIFAHHYDEAEKYLNQSIALDGQRAYAYNALGIAKLERGEFDGAAAAFHTAMRYAPYWAYPIHNLALLESERGNYDESIRLYQAALSAAPQYSYPAYNLGLLYARMGDIANAQTWFEKARVLAQQYRPGAAGQFPERARIWNAEGTLAKTQGRAPKAAELFQKALTDDPSDPNTRQNLALILAAQGNLTRADELWRPNLALKPAFVPSWISYAESLAQRGNNAESIRTYEQVLAEVPSYAGARKALARLYLTQNRPADALQQANSVLSGTAEDSALLELRGDAESQMGNREAAKADWSRASSLAAGHDAKVRLAAKLRTLK